MQFENSVSVTPLGGLGEFGMNLMLVETDEDALILDAGMMFPEPNMLGVDFVLPDITYLVERKEKIRGVLLTHAHEDHVGGLPYVLQHMDIPVYGTKLTLALASGRLSEYGVLSKARLNEIDALSRLTLGAFRCEFFQITHSIPGTLGIILRTPAGIVVHTADYKFDHTPIGSETMDLPKLAELGNEGVLLLLSDSTNAEVPGYTPSERSIAPGLERVFQSAQRRLIVATFASNLYRVQQLLDLAVKFGRHVAVTGRNMVNNIRVASELGYIWVPSNLLIDVREVDDLPPEQVMILTTGTQGEPLSALSLMATGSHAKLKIEPGDTVMISARIIPGHEKEVTNLVNHLFRRGADVHYGALEGIHVSGHGSQEDLKLMLRLVRPKFFIPIHGEYRQLMMHARLAEGVGMSPKDIFVIEDGQKVRLTADSCALGDTARTGRVFVDGKFLENLEEIVLRDRRQLSQDGMVIAVILLDRQAGKVVAGPDIVSRGFVHVDGSEELMTQAKTIAVEAIASMNAEELAEQETVQETVRVALRRFFTKRTDRRPIVIPVIIEV